MGESRNVRAAGGVVFESFGVRVRVTADSPVVLERLPAVLPPHARPCEPEGVAESFGVLADAGGSYRFTRGGSPVSSGLDLEFALMLLQNQIRIYIGLHAANRIFIHAGVVAHEGGAIVIPGRSFTGKTTLVLELVRAGATYYSDEFAVLDEHGLVHPYPKPISIRDQNQVQTDHEVGQLGGVTGDEPLRIASIVFTTYRSGAAWEPRQLSPGRGALAMLDNALAAMERSAEAMRVIKLAIDGAVLLEGERGEAAELAQTLLHTAAGSPG